MIDSGATALFLGKSFVTTHRINTFPLWHPIQVHNIDGTLNQAGSIMHFARLGLTVDDMETWTDFLVTELGGENVILGLPWLRKMNPQVDWEKGRIVVPKTSVTIEEVEDEDWWAGTGNPPLSDSIIESIHASVIEEPPIDSENPPLYHVKANRTTRRALVKKGMLEDCHDDLWIAAGYTYSQQIAEEAHKAKPQRSFEEMVPQEYWNARKVFSGEELEQLPDHKPWDHAIELVPGAPQTMKTKVYPLSINKQEELDKFLEENQRKGYIQPSKSPLASPVFFVKKKDGKLRFVQDYRKLNEYTIKNRYPLPLVTDIVNRLQGAKYFTKFDVRWGYNNVRIKEGDEWKAAFATNQGLFEPLVMFFGLTNSPATFQALMNSIFADLIALGKVAVYLDDILIFTKTMEEHRSLVKEVLRRLQEHDLYLRPEKCEFEKEEIEYLGLVISEGQVRMDPAKVKAVREWVTPRNLRDVRGFLGFANFYRRFIQDFAKITRPLNDLTRKNARFDWGTHQQAAFDTLRKSFTSAPILTLWDPERPTRLEVDASGFATGGALLQKMDDGLWYPIAFRSASMQPAERNYEIYDREMLAIIDTLKDWRYFLEGLPQ